MKTKRQSRGTRAGTRKNFSKHTTRATGEPPPLAVVGIGAYDGDVNVLVELLTHLRADTGMAFVFVQEDSPPRLNHLAEALRRVTSMPVLPVEQATTVHANCVYVNPSSRPLLMQDGTLHLARPLRSSNHQIDRFLTSLANDQGERAIGVVLANAVHDVGVGLNAIKAAGGLTCVQTNGVVPEVLAERGIDFVRPASDLAQELTRIARQRRRASHPKRLMREQFKPLLALLSQASGVDLSHYTTNTLQRSVQRRMLVLDVGTFGAYLTRLRKDVRELRTLMQEILIGFTCFFRDPRAFVALQAQVLPALFRERAHYEALRVWVVGCSTGEEVYSLAILFAEYAREIGSTLPIVIFGSDLNAIALKTARDAFYPKSIERHLTPQRLRRYFTAQETGYQVNQEIRDLCVFAQRNALTDPPFPGCDLISCRNVLLYMEPDLQNRMLPICYLSLSSRGLLFVGAAESVDLHHHWFEPQDLGHGIYAKIPGVQMPEQSFMLLMPALESAESALPPAQISLSEFPVPAPSLNLAERRLFEHYMPTGLLVDVERRIHQHSGRVERYLASQPIKTNQDVLSAVRPGLRPAVRDVLQRSRRENRVVRQRPARMRTREGYQEVLLSVLPLRQRRERPHYYWLLFEDGARVPRGATPTTNKRLMFEQQRRDAVELREELAAMRAEVETVADQLQGSNRHLQVMYEQIQSRGAELRGAQDRLHTTQAMLTASNDELVTINEELRGRLLELRALNEDWLNLLAHVPLAVVMVGSDLRVRRFTPRAREVFGLTDAHLGGLLPDLGLDLRGAELPVLLQAVIASGEDQEVAMRDRHGVEGGLQVRALRRDGGVIDGAVLLVAEVTRREGRSDS